jgi:hypothetical protein
MGYRITHGLRLFPGLLELASKLQSSSKRMAYAAFPSLSPIHGVPRERHPATKQSHENAQGALGFFGSRS